MSKSHIHVFLKGFEELKLSKQMIENLWGGRDTNLFQFSLVLVSSGIFFVFFLEIMDKFHVLNRLLVITC